MKNVFAVLLAISLFIILPVNVIGAADQAVAVVSFDNQYWSTFKPSENAMVNGKKVGNILNLSLISGDELKIPFDLAGFVFEPAASPAEAAPNILQDSAVEAKYVISAGAPAIDSVNICMDDLSLQSYISVKFQKDLVYTKEMDIEVSIYLALDGKKNPITEFSVSGKISNPVVIVSDQDNYVDLSRGFVAEAENYIKDIHVDIGNGIEIVSSLFEGSRYYGISKVEAPDSLISSLYPEIEKTYILKTVGLKRSGRDVVIFNESEKYYVYDSNGDYLGTTERPLPYSSMYYLSLTDIGQLDFPNSQI